LLYLVLVADKLVYYKDHSINNQLGEINLNQANEHFREELEQETVLIDTQDAEEENRRHSRNSGTFPKWKKNISLQESASVSDLGVDAKTSQSHPAENKDAESKTGSNQEIINHYILTITLPHKEYSFKARSQEERDTWLNHIRERQAFNNTKLQGKKDEQSIKEGNLKKLGGNVKNWQDRYFVLTLNALKYYKEITDQKPAGKIDLKKGVSLKPAGPDDERPFMFTITPTGSKRKYCLEAADSEEMEDWLNAITRRLALSKEKEEEGKKMVSKTLTPSKKSEPTKKPTKSSKTPKQRIKVMGF